MRNDKSSLKAFRRLMKRHSQLLAVLLIAAMGLAAWGVRVTASPEVSETVTTQPMAQLVQTRPGQWTENIKPFSDLMADVDAGVIEEVVVGSMDIFVTRKDGSKYAVSDQFMLGASNLFKLAVGKPDPGFAYSTAETVDEVPLTRAEIADQVLRVLVILVITISVWPMISPWLPRLGRKPKPNKVSFDDVIGCEEAKRALLDIVSSQRDARMYQLIGATPPRGVLLTGDPGTGKTQLAKALAHECGIDFIAATGSDFSSMFMGVGIMKVQALFRRARRKAPCILFIDEIDGVGRRQTEARFGEAETNRIVNQLLTEMDGFGASSGVLVVAATNHPEAIDPALRREGRFDRTIHVQLPSKAERRQLLELYLGKLKSVGAMDLERMAAACIGFTPAAIATVVNQAAILAIRGKAEEVLESHLRDSIESHRIGERPKGGAPIRSEERELIAHHEAGHALAAALLKTGQLDLVTILPRGSTLGTTVVVPVEDKRIQLASEVRNSVMVLLAGRVAEKIAFGETSSGAAHDLREATRLVGNMVGMFGMSSSGRLTSLAGLADCGVPIDAESVQLQIQVELQTLSDKCEELLMKHEPAMTAVARLLLQEETIEGQAVLDLLDEYEVVQAQRVKADACV
ncbi:AAA family ATPase [Pseudomonas sp. NCHU5208]|uniref:AAA family ATPase n=1 Tax=unclassified Pseudomonas TaxID=196821 RepID=UPI003F960537